MTELVHYHVEEIDLTRRRIAIEPKIKREVRTELRVDVDEARLQILARQCIGQCRAVPGIGHTGPREIVEHERGAGRAKNIGTERSELRADETRRSEEHTYELNTQMRISYAVICLNKKNIV